MTERIIAPERADGKGRRPSRHEQPSAFRVGDQVIRRREPNSRYEETPLIGVIEEILVSRLDGQEKAVVRWPKAQRDMRVAGGLVDNHSTVRLSALLAATPENVEQAEKQLRGRKSQAWIHRALFYEEMAGVRERQGLPDEAKWMREEARQARDRAEKAGS